MISRGIFQRYLAHRINNQFQIFHNLPPDQNGGCFNLVLCYVMLPHFICKIWCSQWAKSYALLCCVMICYADLFYEQNPKLSMSKILWSVMLPLLRDYDWNICEQTLCTVMNSYLMSKILLDLMKLTVSYCNQE